MTTRIAAYFSPCYCPPAADPSGAHFARLDELKKMLEVEPFWEWQAATPVSAEWLVSLHSESYVQAMMQGIEPLSRSAHLPWSRALVEACSAMVGGQIAAADRALGDGVAMNLAVGFHHAHPERGGGFCVFNGLAAVAVARRDLQIIVLDCDEHGGDGTAAFADRLANLRTVSIFGTRFGVRTNQRNLALRVPVSERTGAAFSEVLAQALDYILQLNPDLVLYQAGADMHENDPKATLKLTEGDLLRRDQQVFGTLKQAGIAVLCSFAGGYQTPIKTAALYAQTAGALKACFV